MISTPKFSLPYIATSFSLDIFNCVSPCHIFLPVIYFIEFLPVKSVSPSHIFHWVSPCPTFHWVSHCHIFHRVPTCHIFHWISPHTHSPSPLSPNANKQMKKGRRRRRKDGTFSQKTLIYCVTDVNSSVGCKRPRKYVNALERELNCVSFNFGKIKILMLLRKLINFQQRNVVIYV